jgi:hypothetical protein
VNAEALKTKRAHAKVLRRKYTYRSASLKVESERYIFLPRVAHAAAFIFSGSDLAFYISTPADSFFIQRSVQNSLEQKIKSYSKIYAAALRKPRHASNSVLLKVRLDAAD